MTVRPPGIQWHYNEGKKRAREHCDDRITGNPNKTKKWYFRTNFILGPREPSVQFWFKLAGKVEENKNAEEEQMDRRRLCGIKLRFHLHIYEIHKSCKKT